jgi:hypothetical protein
LPTRPGGREVVVTDSGCTGVAEASFEDAELPTAFTASMVK